MDRLRKPGRIEEQLQVVDSNVLRVVPLAAGILSVMVLGDALVYAWPKAVPQTVWALLDAPVHLILALVVVSPLFAHPAIHSHVWTWLWIAAAAAVLIDLDHFIAARSLAIEDALSLGNRPLAHSLLFTLLVALVTWAISRQPLGALLVLGVLLSHLVRDASHGSIPLWWPLPGSVTVPIPLYYAIEIVLGVAALWITGRTSHATWMDWLLALIGR